MASRVDEFVDRLPVGYRDEGSATFVPPELRAFVAGVDEATVEKLRKGVWQERGTVSMSRGRRFFTATMPEDHEVVLGWRINSWAALRLRDEELEVERAAAEAHEYTCPCCTAVKPPDGLLGRGTRSWTLCDGHTVVACQDCFRLLDALAFDALRAQVLPDGRSRGDAAQTLFASLPNS